MAEQTDLKEMLGAVYKAAVDEQRLGELVELSIELLGVCVSARRDPVRGLGEVVKELATQVLLHEQIARRDEQGVSIN